MVHKAVLRAALVVCAPPFASGAFAAGTDLRQLLGKDPGTASAYSCFTRHYDDAHLASHPKQNVRDMSVFVSSTYNKDADAGGDRRTNAVEIGVKFRKLAQPFRLSGGCETSVDGQKNALDCGADCDGGHFDMSSDGKNSMLVAIPDSVALWDPAASDDDDPHELPKGAAFGSDDKLFKLDRVDVKQCDALMTDEAKQAIFGSAEEVK
jgi:hypothetical protein